MTTIALLVSIAGGAATAGEVSAAVGQSCQVSATLPSGVTIARFEILAYPPGFACPSGWTTEGENFVYVGASPSSFTLDRWGKWRFGLRYSSLHHVTTCIDIESPQPLSLRDMANGEQDEFGGCLEDHQYNLRQLDAIIGGLTSSTVTSVTGVNLIEADPTTGDVEVGIDMTTALLGQVVMATGSPLAATWESLGDIAGGHLHKADYCIWENVDITTPGSSIQGFTLGGTKRLLLCGQTIPSQNGIQVWSGASTALTRPADWTGTIDNTIAHAVACAEWAAAVMEFYPISDDTTPDAVLMFCSNSGSFIVDTNSTGWRIAGPSTGYFFKPHQPVYLALDTNIDISSPGATHQGVTLVTDERLALWGQTNGRENGIYHYNGAASPLARENDFPAHALMFVGGYHKWPVLAGTYEGGELWVYGEGEIGTTGFDWRMNCANAAVQSITEGTGIDVSDDGDGNFTISNDGVLSVTGGDGCSNTGTAANPVMTVNVDGTSIVINVDTLSAVPTTHVVAAAATKNVNISSPGTDVFDTVVVVEDDVVWLPQQTTGSQNGPWVWHAEDGAMTRPAWWDAAATVAAGSVRVVLDNGELWKGTEFVLLADCVVDTDTPSVEHLDGPDYVIDTAHAWSVTSATEQTIAIAADEAVRIRVVGEVTQNAWREWVDTCESAPSPDWASQYSNGVKDFVADKPSGTSGTNSMRIRCTASGITYTALYKEFPFGASSASRGGGGYHVQAWGKGSYANGYSVFANLTVNTTHTVTGADTDQIHPDTGWGVMDVSSARSNGTVKYVVLWHTNISSYYNISYSYYDHIFATRQDVVREPFEINRMWVRRDDEAPAEYPNYGSTDDNNATNTSETAPLVTITGGGNSVMIDSTYPGLDDTTAQWKVKARVWIERSMLDPLTDSETEPEWVYT